MANFVLISRQLYCLEDIESFNERVYLRRDIGRILLSFKEGAPPFVLRASVGKLRNLFAQDPRLLTMLEQLEHSLNLPEANPTERDRVIRAIRTHISDTYRLHRRMLRNRRDTVEDVLLDQSNATLQVEYDLDERSPTVQEYLDEWRIRAIANTAGEDDPYYQQLRQIFLLLFSTSGTWLTFLEWVLLARLNGEVTPALSTELGATALDLLLNTPQFSGEADILQSLLDVIQQPSEYGDRVEHLQMVLKVCIKSSGQQPPKIVVFTSFTHTCRELVQQLSSTFGKQAIATYQVGQSLDEIEENTNQFKDDPSCCVLVCGVAQWMNDYLKAGTCRCFK